MAECESCTALRREQEQVQQQIAMLKQLLHESRAAEATGAAAVSELKDELANLRAELNGDGSASSDPIRSLGLRKCLELQGETIAVYRQQLADQSTALSQIVREMRIIIEGHRRDAYRDIMCKWADRLDGLLIAGSGTTPEP